MSHDEHLVKIRVVDDLPWDPDTKERYRWLHENNIEFEYMGNGQYFFPDLQDIVLYKLTFGIEND